MKLFFKAFGAVIAIAASFFVGALFGPLDFENYLAKSAKPIPHAVYEHKPFVVIVPSYNNSEWVERNLHSVFSQKYDNYRVIYIDDASTDATLELVREWLDREAMGHRVDIWHNETNKGACENIFRAVRSCQKEEIVVLLDGDDWFAHERVLERLNQIYADPDVWLTYGSYIEYPRYAYTVANFSRPLPKKVVKKNGIREFSRKHWHLGHLHTFYASLYDKIDEADLKFEGKFYDATYDLAIMIPMVEMAGPHVKFVEDILYIYNRATPLNDHKLRFKRQQQIAQHILDLPHYGPIDALEEKK